MTTEDFCIVFPNESWERSEPNKIGWSTEKLTEVAQYLRTVPEGSLMIVEKGRVVAEWGNVARPVKLSSVRKSLLSALYGIYVHEGRIDPSMTLEQLAIDDSPPLTSAERQATILDILKARSGIYRGFVGGTPAMRAQMPARGSHAPGTFWYYNDWDFNAAGTIFEQQVGLDLGTAFQDRVGSPLQMQDFRAEDVYYVTAPPGKPADETSIHRAYQFRMSTRDLARFGYLFLRGAVGRVRASFRGLGCLIAPRHTLTRAAEAVTATSGGSTTGRVFRNRTTPPKARLARIL
jgi:CubicO group peptidase (beta-lactamase class C family)